MTEKSVLMRCLEGLRKDIHEHRVQNMNVSIVEGFMLLRQIKRGANVFPN